MGIRKVLGHLWHQCAASIDKRRAAYVDDSPPLRGEFALAQYLLEQPDVAALCGGSQLDLSVIKRQIQNGMDATTRHSCEIACKVVELPQFVERSRSLDLLSKLLCYGTDELRAAFTTPDMKPGDIPFVTAHGSPEAAFRASWPDSSTSISVEIVNDDVSPIEYVYPALQGEMGLTAEDAIKLTLRIHRAGFVRVAPPASSDPVTFCMGANGRWRDSGLALYCRPSTGPTAPAEPATPAPR